MKQIMVRDLIVAHRESLGELEVAHGLNQMGPDNWPHLLEEFCPTVENTGGCYTKP